VVIRRGHCAPAARLKEIEFIGDAAVTELKIVEAAASLMSSSR